MTTWRQRFAVGITLATLCFALLGGLGSTMVHASGSLTKGKGVAPNSCYWIGDASQQNNTYNTNGTVAGYYKVFEQHNSCMTSYHQALGEIVITASSFTCTTAHFNVELYGNSVPLEGASVPSGVLVGGSSNGCAYGTVYSLATGTYNNSSYAYCAEMTNVSFGTSLSSLKAGSSCP